MTATDGVNINVEPSSDDGRMQADVDAHAAAMAAHVQLQQQAAAQQQQQPPPMEVMVQQMMQGIMQNIMQQVNNAFAQNGGQIPGGNPATAGVQTGTSVPWQQDKSLGNVRKKSGQNGGHRPSKQFESATTLSQTTW